MKSWEAKARVDECLNIVADKTSMSPMHYSDVDDYIDAYVDEAMMLFGPLNAAQRSAIRSMAREDSKRYAALEGW